MTVYFTGTGNSRYIAESIAKTLCDSTVDAAKLIKSGENPSFFSEKPYVFVSPVYAWRMPRVFEKWIKGCTFNGSKKAYFILTCGSEIGAAGNYIKTFCDGLGLEYMGTSEVVMPENYLVMFDPTPKEEDDGIISDALARAERLCEKISREELFDKTKIPFVGYLESTIVNSSFYTFYIGAKKFYVTDKCIKCGKCAENCMLGNITLKDSRPTWGKNCTHCMACICKCPTEAIEYGKKTKGRRRYVCTRKI